jgi:filamentous hemagglutinin
VVGSIRGSGNTLTIVDNNALTIGLAGLSTTNVNVSIRAGDGAITNNLTISGPLSAGTRDVTLNAPSGTIGGAGLITATNLSINSSGATTVSTNIGNLSATTAGTALTVTEANGLSINAAGINTADGAATIVLTAGNLGGSGVINAGAGDVSLRTAAGNVTLTAAQAVRGNNLSLTALNSSAVNTMVANITASITGLAQSLRVTETNDLALAAAGISTNNGNLAVTLAGNLTGSGKLALGTGTATLTSNAGNITPAGTITAGTLVLTAQNTSSVNTTITSLQAKVSSGGLTVTETADLAIAAGGVSTANAATLNVLAGNLTGTGNVSASDSTTGNVTLNVAAGNVTLNTIAGQVRAGNVLNISANTTSVVRSNVANLTATIRNGGVTVVEANNLNIFTGGINTSGANGPISLTLTTGNLSSGSNLVNAGLGNVAISAAGGTVTLNGTAGQVAGNVLTLAARGDTTVRTAVNTLDAVLTTTTGTGNLSVTDTNDLTVNRAVTTNGNVTLNVGANTLTVNNITAARAALGDVTLIAKNVVVNGVGITASDTLDLTGVTGNVNVTAGVMNAASVSQTAGSRVNWQVNTLESGAGSLRSVITNTNNFKGKSQVNIATPTTITLASSLPWIKSDLMLLGNNNLTINAGSAATGFVFSGANASVSNVALSGFSGTAITLLPNTAKGITINGVNVTNSVVGLQASGNVTGSTVSNSIFDGKSRANATGISLSGTTGLTISKNTLQNATIGLQASGSFTNTLVQTNTFDRLSRYGISLASATSTAPASGLVIGPATGNDFTLANTMSNITGAGTAGVFATGFCTNTVVRKTRFINVTNPYAVARSRNLTINN